MDHRAVPRTAFNQYKVFIAQGEPENSLLKSMVLLLLHKIAIA